MAPKLPPSKRRRKSETAAGNDLPSPSPSPAKEKEKEKEKERGVGPVVVFAHGAGAPSTSDWMLRWKKMTGDALEAVEVITFDYPYISGGKKRAPPKAEKLIDHHLNVVKDAVNKYPDRPLVLMGKSMGSRVSCMVAGSDEIHVAAIVCLGYPLKGMNGAVRDETLIQLKAPTMFVQGSKDGLCPSDKLETTRKKMSCKNEVHIINGGDHSFKIGKKFLESSGITQDQAEREAVEAIANFISKSIN
ncbi:hypothetical protein LUZ60_010084 [Juncus effusus]|nr:hypothetical protein LUZ60_010084 [Juncus effusus]